ncbi:GNAT family N-acetyltransferase [Luteimonas chenhongjianii]|uniref:GNAT family N-acetyltransferase n=1 Tax=Luteimonas chenhongjianii TaxID=2006110 RepID=UPI0012FE016A|nr:GNAT family N-acetyltransferase [Luteimonas chenhongjianii]
MSEGLLHVLRHSQVESNRFGLRVVRGMVTKDAPRDQVRADIERLKPDIAIFRCEAGDTRQIDELAKAGLVPRHADTLVYYKISLDRPTIGAPAVDDGGIGQAEVCDAASLEAIVRRGFAGYRNHYHANPLLSEAAILDGYVEWALDYAIRPAEGQQTWVYRIGGQARSFATCKLRADRSEVEIVLNATDPAWTGRGLYSSLLKSLIAYYRRAGFAALVISTQVWNYGVQRVWSRTGLVIHRAFDTYHVNVPASASEVETTCP